MSGMAKDGISSSLIKVVRALVGARGDPAVLVDGSAVVRFANEAFEAVPEFVRARGAARDGVALASALGGAGYRAALRNRAPKSRVAVRLGRRGGAMWYVDYVPLDVADGGKPWMFVSMSSSAGDDDRATGSTEGVVGRIIAAQEGERAHIAAELHDGANQKLASVSLGISLLRRSSQQPELRRKLQRLQQEVIEASEEIRGISHDLHPEILRHAGLAWTLLHHCEAVAERQGVRVDSKGIAFDFREPTREVALALYRAAQEGMANSVKHSSAAVITVALRAHDGKLELTIVDDGVGIKSRPALRRGGLGLISIAQRAEHVGGRMSVARGKGGRGTVLTVEVPHETASHAGRRRRSPDSR